MLVGIDLFARRCIEGVQLTRTATPVTYPPQLTWRQPPKRLGVGACSGFGRSRSERVFRNEFPYLGRASPAAWAGFRLVGGDGIVRSDPRFGRAGPNPGARAWCARCGAQGQGSPEGPQVASRSACTERPGPRAAATGGWRA